MLNASTIISACSLYPSSGSKKASCLSCVIAVNKLRADLDRTPDNSKPMESEHAATAVEHWAVISNTARIAVNDYELVNSLTG